MAYLNRPKLWSNKLCLNCNQKTNKGQYLVLKDNPSRQRWVCNECIEKGHQPKERKYGNNKRKSAKSF
jgi:hypothetical protein